MGVTDNWWLVLSCTAVTVVTWHVHELKMACDHSTPMDQPRTT